MLLRKKQRTHWIELAERSGLTYEPPDILLWDERGWETPSGYVVGTYRGRSLQLSTYKKRTRAAVASGWFFGFMAGHFVNNAEVVLWNPLFPKYTRLMVRLDGPAQQPPAPLTVDDFTQRLHFEQRGVESDVDYLQALIGMLCDVAAAIEIEPKGQPINAQELARLYDDLQRLLTPHKHSIAGMVASGLSAVAVLFFLIVLIANINQPLERTFASVTLALPLFVAPLAALLLLWLGLAARARRRKPLFGKLGVAASAFFFLFGSVLFCVVSIVSL